MHSTQNNEKEALRSWKDALDQIQYLNLYRLPSNYKPKNETEAALQESLHELELQCRERVDLLEALRQSRADLRKAEGPPLADPGRDVQLAPHLPLRRYPPTERDRRIVEGAFSSSRSHDPPGPPLPRRPSIPSNTSSEVIGEASKSPSQHLEERKLSSPVNSKPARKSHKKHTSRTPSPEKRSGLLRTLRPATKDKAARDTIPKLPNTLRNKPPAAAKAATQAWGSLSRPDSVTNNSTSDIQDVETVQVPNILNTRKERGSFERTVRASEARRVDDTRFKTPVSCLSSYSDIKTHSGVDNLEVTDSKANSNQNIPTTTPSTKTPASYPIVAEWHNGQAQKTPISNNTSKLLPYRKEYCEKFPMRKTIATTHQDIPPGIDSGQQQGASQSDSRWITEDRSRILADFGQDGSKKRAGDQSKLEAKTSSLFSNEELSETLTENGHIYSNQDESSEIGDLTNQWKIRVSRILEDLPKGIDEAAAKQIMNEIVIQGDEVHWDDVAGLEIAKSALKETVVYPFLRPDLFMGLREPARGMLLFGPPGTGKTMLARAVATESRSTFFAISASSLTSKFLGESEKLVRALFVLAKKMAPSIIFVDEIDSLLSTRSGSGEHEATRRIKTEFLIQWSDLARAAAGKEPREKGDASRVLVLAATNLPWAIDEAARRRFVRRQYIPLPEAHVRRSQLQKLLNHQNHELSPSDLDKLIDLTDGM